MKSSILLAALAVGLIGCSDKTAESNGVVATEQSATDQKEMAQSLKGNWINETFYNKLMATKSMANASKNSESELLFFSSNETSEYTHIYNFHEGVSDAKMVKDADGYYVLDYDNAQKYKVEFLTEDKIKINNIVYVRVDHANKMNEDLTAHYFLAGKYKVGSKEIELTRDGAVLNWDYASYETVKDYIESSGADRLKFNGAIEVVYIIDGDDVIIYEPECETMEGEECYGYKPGKELHRLVKIK